MRTAGLPLLAAPGEVVRFAVHLDVIVDGKPVTVPAGIGVDVPARSTSPLYTSDTSGIVHVTSNSDQSVFTLGQFFAAWQVPLTSEHLGGLRASRSAPVAVTAPVPAAYAFPAGT